MTALRLSYQLIELYYGSRLAKRSQVPLMNHIREGLAVLQALDADEDTQAAYCLHPYLQSDANFMAHKRDPRLRELPAHVLLLTMEYRRIANSYLSTAHVSAFVGFSCPEVRQMLIADKVQNYKDFLCYHKDKHPRSEALNTYFMQWMQLLEVDYTTLVNLTKSSIIIS